MKKKNSIKELRKSLIQQTKKRVVQEYGEKERHIIRAINALEDLDATSNLLFEHTREWYHVFFPELEHVVEEPETFLRLVYEIGSKKRFLPDEMNAWLSNPKLQARIAWSAQESIGANEDPAILKEIQLLALNTLNLKEERKFLECFIEKQMLEQAQNFSRLAGTLLGARLLAKAASFQRLAELPASTLQLLGAEKALFRHLKTKRKAASPKYGLLYGHSLVKQLPPAHRGKMARSLAGKLSIAIKEDVFGKQFIAKALQKQLQNRFEALQKSFIKPKKKPQKLLRFKKRHKKKRKKC